MEDSGAEDDNSEDPSNSEDHNQDIEENNKPKRKLSRLWLHAAIMCGREFLYAVEIVLVTPIILQLGMPEKFYSFMWCFSPIIGILIGPVIGSNSDRCTSRFGRRRPYIVVLVFGALMGLTLLIFSKDIAFVLGGDEEDKQRLWGVIVGVLGAQSMDFCLDQSETPLRAYTLDVCSSDDQQRAFALQTVFIGVGGALGFIIDGIDWENTALSSFFGSQIKVVYVFAVLVCLATTICNLVSIKEIPWKKKISPSRKPHLCRCASSKFSRKSSSTHAAKCSNCSNTIASEETSSHLSTPSLILSSLAPTVLVPICEEDTDEISKPEQYRNRLSRPVSLIPRISMSKGLFMSTSCPGGLDEYSSMENADSSSSLTKNDSAFDEGSNLQSASSDEINYEEISFSLPTLRIKPHLPQGKSLVDFIRSKEFSIWTSKSRNNFSVSSEVINATRHNSDSSKRLLEDNDVRTKPAKASDASDSVVIVTTYDSNCQDACVNEHCQLDMIALNCSVSSDANSVCAREKYHSKKERKKATTKENSPNHKGDSEEGERHVSLKQLWLSVITMPSQLKWLCLCQLLGFVGIETLMLWYTDLMGRVVYEGDPQAPINSTEFAQYNAGVKIGCWGLTVYSVAMIVFSVAMERFSLLSRFNIRYIYSFAFFATFIVMLVMFIFANKYVILVLSWCVGVTIAIMLTVPYFLVGKYHEDKKYISKSPGNSRRGFGLDCAILACQMYFGNVLSASLSSPVIHAAGTCKAMLLLTGGCHLLAFFSAYFFVTYPGTEQWCWSRRRRESSATTEIIEVS